MLNRTTDNEDLVSGRISRDRMLPIRCNVKHEDLLTAEFV
jgi:hypothetical protein